MPIQYSIHPVIVVGAGISGLAVACRLKRLGVQATILDQAGRVAEPWRSRHEQLRLNTHRHLSRLPGLAFPRSAGPFPSRDAVIDYLEEYVRSIGTSIEFGVHVDRIVPSRGIWEIRTSAGLYHARHVVVATGRERVPVMPDWPGMEGFAGKVIHAADFGCVETYRDRRILVIGAGNSGIDILNHLVRIPTGELWVAVRHGPVVIPARLCGVPVQRFSGLMARLPVPIVDAMLAATSRLAFGDLRRLGLRRHRLGALTRLLRDGVAPAIDDGFVEALRAHRIKLVPAVERFERACVVAIDGQRLRPDVVICATGYRPGLEALVGHLNVLDRNGIPRPRSEDGHAAHPGLWFIGMWPQLQGNFYAVNLDSRRIAEGIHGALRLTTGSSTRYFPARGTSSSTVR